MESIDDKQLQNLKSLKRAYLRQLNANYFHHEIRQKMYRNIEKANDEINRLEFKIELEREIEDGKFR